MIIAQTQEIYIHCKALVQSGFLLWKNLGVKKKTPRLEFWDNKTLLAIQGCETLRTIFFYIIFSHAKLFSRLLMFSLCLVK